MNASELELVKVYLDEMMQKYTQTASLSFDNESIEGNYAGYNHHDNSIVLHANLIAERANKNSWRILDAFHIVLAHELGHVNDQSLPSNKYKVETLTKEFRAFFKDLIDQRKYTIENFDEFHDRREEISRITFKLEMDALEIGKQFVPNELLPIYLEDNYYNLREYDAQSQRDADMDAILYELRDNANSSLPQAQKRFMDKARARFEILHGIKPKM